MATYANSVAYTWKSCEFLHTQEAGAELDENSDTIPTESDDLLIDIHLIVNLNKFSSLTKLIERMWI